jgi:nicotinate phosphoribosyltransferase
MTSTLKLDPAILELPVHELRIGHHSAVYFRNAKRVLEREGTQAVVTHQVFQKQNNVCLCGMHEVYAILRYAAGYYRDYDTALYMFGHYREVQRELRYCEMQGDKGPQLKLAAELFEISQSLENLWVDKSDDLDIWALSDGTVVSENETVLLIEGEYRYFAHLESQYLGILARRSRVASNARAVVTAAGGKPVFYFADRYDHFSCHAGDGYAARIAGVHAVASDSMASWYGEKGTGTIPHALIVAFGGDSVLTTEKFNQYFPDVNTIALVDFDNDCVATSLSVANKLGKKLWGVRLDTSEKLIDKSLQNSRTKERKGVAPKLIEKVRNALDNNGFEHVKIVVSGGFNPDRITRYEALQVPVDVYAVGSWMLQGRFDFTADAVRLNGENIAKTGRQYNPNNRLQKINNGEG